MASPGRTLQHSFLLAVGLTIFIQEISSDLRMPSFSSIKAASLSRSLSSKSNSSCFSNYYLNSNCETSDDQIRNLIRDNGELCMSTHLVNTSDGYILTVFRIENCTGTNMTKGVVVFVHGLLQSASCWVWNRDSFALALARKGYDVWLVNLRASYFSLGHQDSSRFCNNTNREFWKTSWADSGKKDMPAVVNYISGVTNQTKMAFAGHSEGGTVLLVFLTMCPKFNENVTVVILLNPAAYFNHSEYFLLRVGVRVERVLRKLEGPVPIDCNLRDGCKALGWKSCNALIDFLYGQPCPKYYNESMSKYYINFTPKTSPFRCLEHYVQNTKCRDFKEFDYYNDDENMKHYNQKKPPPYPLKNFVSPTVLYAGGNDYVCNIKDQNYLNQSLPNVIDYIVGDCAGHMDILFTNKIPYIYDLMEQRIREYQNKYDQSKGRKN